ncbi:hypothetical protein CHO01_38360 [Cellulomonas hominis]|uniref:Uncharacterized protein n=1 Tax=Cellulomonas hominis TaxID=156981 RepID=A0A511FHM0_9CELL|nr:hypothetical protein CHO01_38360 [Cellulomonas hominis]
MACISPRFRVVVVRLARWRTGAATGTTRPDRPLRRRFGGSVARVCDPTLARVPDKPCTRSHTGAADPARSDG